MILEFENRQTDCIKMNEKSTERDCLKKNRQIATKETSLLGYWEGFEAIYIKIRRTMGVGTIHSYREEIVLETTEHMCIEWEKTGKLLSGTATVDV